MASARKHRSTAQNAPFARKKGRKGAHARFRTQARRWGRLLAMLGGATFALLAAAVAGAAYLVASSPAPEGRIWTANRPPVVVVQAADGSEIAAFGRTAGRAVSLGDLPRHVPDAVLAAEDRNFHHHWGFNPVAWARAAIVNIRSGSVRQGGSTITQQLAKNLFLSPERTFERKLRELIYAIWLETRFSKDEILTLYLNRVYFGGGAYGIDAAAIRYFDKSARDLSVAEAATLAGLLKAPARYSPSARPGNAGARGAEVLRNMVRAGFLTRAEAEAAAREPLYLAPPDNPTAPYFADAALAEAERLLGGLEINVVVETTLEPRLQGALAAAVAGGFDGGEGEPADLEAAALVLDERGAVRALVGGRDYRRSQFNRAVAARRQPGSAFKTFVYLAGLEAGYDPYTTVLDAPIRIADWAPGNYKDRYYGEVSLEEAYARSLNSAAVRVQQAVGVRHVQQVAERLGVVSPLDKSAALALGVSETTPIELAGAYAAVANGGFSVEPHLVAAIRTPEGRPIYERAAASDRVLDPRVAFEMKEMMRATVDYGSGFRARAAAVDVGGKTGTTQSGRDGWFAGFADDYTGVVWVGRDSGGPVADLSGSREPAAIWGAFARMLSDRPRTPAGAPAVLVEAAAAPGDLDALLISLETEDPALAPYDP